MHPDFSHLIRTFHKLHSLHPNMCFLPCTVPYVSPCTGAVC